MGLLVYMFIISVHYCSCNIYDNIDYEDGTKVIVKHFPTKVKPGFLQLHLAGKYLKPKPAFIKKNHNRDKKTDLTVFPNVFDKNSGVPDSPYFPLEKLPERKFRVKKVLTENDWISLRRKRSVDRRDERKRSELKKNGWNKGRDHSFTVPGEPRPGKPRPGKPRPGKPRPLKRIIKPKYIKSNKFNPSDILTKPGQPRPGNPRPLKRIKKSKYIKRNKRNPSYKLKKRVKRPKHSNVKNRKHRRRRGMRTDRRNAAKLISKLGEEQAMKVIKARSQFSQSKKGARRLIAARDALIEDYPYVVSIQKDKMHWCAGALLNQRLVITTANCLWKSNRLSYMKVRAGSRHTDRGGQVAKIKEVMKHPAWNIRAGPDNDIGLVVLDRNIKFSHGVHGVDLPNRVMLPPFEDVWVTSWGTERRDGVYERKASSLQVYHARIMDRKKCNNVTQRFGVSVSENFICLAQTGRRAPCTRDTGAPAVSDGVLWGLASWGIRKLCGTERYPAMFSYVGSDSNMDFIINATHYLMADERYYPFLDRPRGIAGASPVNFPVSQKSGVP